MREKPATEPVLCFARPEQWSAWLEQNHQASAGAGVLLGKGGEGGLSYGQALEIAQGFGWIDRQKYTGDADAWVQRFVPQREAQAWTKVPRPRARRTPRSS